MQGFKKASVAAAIGAAAVLVLSACGTTGGGGSSETFKIAYQGPLTGGDASFGANAKAGIVLALSNYEEEYPDGPEVTIVWGDDQGAQDQAPNVAASIISDPLVLGVVGPAFSGPTEVSAPAYEEAGLVLVSPSATRVSLSTNGWDVFHRVVATDAAQGPAAARLTSSYSDEVFLIDDKSAYGEGLADIIEPELGDALVERLQVEPTQDYTTVAQQVIDSGAGALYYAGYQTEGGLLVKALRDKGWTGIFASGDGAHGADFLAAAGSAAEGALLTNTSIGADEGFTADWEAVTASDKGELGAYSTESFDAAWVLLSGIGEGNVTRSDLLEWVNTYDADGFTKHIAFDETGEVAGGATFVYEVKDGEFLPGVLIP